MSFVVFAASSVVVVAAVAAAVLGGGIVVSAASDNVFIINNASDLIKFSNDVNSGTDYSGTTVLLDSDIDFGEGLSQQFQPIGNFYVNGFLGVFIWAFNVSSLFTALMYILNEMLEYHQTGHSQKHACGIQ